MKLLKKQKENKMKIFKIHHSQLNQSYPGTFLQCRCCGMEDTRASNGDVSWCSDCNAVEQGFETAYLGADGELYAEKDIDWEFETLVGV
jgi:hypothetical protein